MRATKIPTYLGNSRRSFPHQQIANRETKKKFWMRCDEIKSNMVNLYDLYDILECNETSF